MKKITSILITALLILFSLTSFISCAKNGEGTPITGKWQAEISFKNLISDSGGASPFEAQLIDLSEYAVTLNFEFKDSGSMTVGVNSAATEESAKALFEEYVDRILSESGAPEDEVLSSMGYDSKEEAVRDMLKNTDFSSFGGESVKYTFEDGVLGYGSAKIKTTLDGDTLTLEEVLSESEKDAPYVFIEYHLPMELTKKQ